MIVVSDTSPLLNLCRVGAFSLLEQLYGKVIAPPEVLEELIRNGVEPSEIPGLVMQSPTDQEAVSKLLVELDPGEAASIILAIEVRADVVFLDERRGRKTAAAMGLEVVGLLGILAEAKRRGLIGEAKPILDRLMGEAGFWISAGLYEAFLRQVGEAG